MELSLIQKDILITLITLYHQKSAAIKGEGIAEVLKRNPGTVRNQMQALKVLGLVDGVPGPKGGYTPTSAAYKELNLTDYEREYSVPIQRNCERCEGVNVAEIDFTTLCHPDLCHAVIKLIGSVKSFEIGDEVTVGPSPVNRLLVKGEIYGKDEVSQQLLITIAEIISLPKKQIRYYMSSPVITLKRNDTLRTAIKLFNEKKIHGAPVMDVDNEKMVGIITLSDLIRGIDREQAIDAKVERYMTNNVIIVSPEIHLYEVIKQFKEQQIGRVIIMEDGKPAGILTQSDIIKVFPAL
ncbi:MAG: CBS domain-containing protein [Methanomicrobium sp.]|nr:CBS domain-containing protein [Methanomicrobium sp.]MBP5083213.1 CBS domain-containing protein [Methanomicrobium sp.]MBQ3684160.1 CBS domain-containing protein [Methanomicrobium sp.]MBQ3718929.1 CBS domain-containing protein [Methanomicrobium sp.]MBQ4415210.1 CBS domain-containing protein [Methanomicrobium sp.]